MSTNPLGFGTYYPATSLIHRLDPRIKLLSLILLMMMLFTFSSLWVNSMIGLFLYTLSHFSHVRFMWWQTLRSIWFILLLVIVMNLFLIPGEPLLPQFESIPITAQGFIKGMIMGSRLLLTVITSSLLILTTSPFILTHGIETLLSPLKKVGIPIAEIAFMIHLTLRFIPTFAREKDNIIKAQAARGHDTSSGNLSQRAKGMIMIIIPLLVSSFRRVDELENAMEARLFRVGIMRTNLKEVSLKPVDYLAIGTIILFSGSIFLIHLL